jgi:hypothetical protein
MKNIEDIIANIGDEHSLEKAITKTVSLRLPVLYLARIDALASLKDTSRNVLLNDLVEAALNELLTKLQAKNEPLANKLEEKAQELVQRLLAEHDLPPPPPHKKIKLHEKE